MHNIKRLLRRQKTITITQKKYAELKKAQCLLGMFGCPAIDAAERAFDSIFPEAAWKFNIKEEMKIDAVQNRDSTEVQKYIYNIYLPKEIIENYYVVGGRSVKGN